MFSVNAIFCFFQGEENDVKKVYADFPRWKEKFADLILINSGNYVKPDKKPLALLQYGNGIYDGLELFMLEKDQSLKQVKNHRSLEPIQLDMISCDQCYDKEKMQALFANTGNLREIAISYELLIVAYRAVLRHDFRSAIIIAATALEKAILKRIKKYYVENSLTTFEQDRKQHKMLGKEFGWLNELGISIPVQNYQTEILDVRNSTAHEGKSQNYDTTMEYLNRCKMLIQEYCPDVLD